MQKHPDILQQVGRMALATAGCSAIMLAIYAVVGRFTTAVLLGGLLGTVIAVGNFLAALPFLTRWTVPRQGIIPQKRA